jgi:hypothetical protein
MMAAETGHTHEIGTIRRIGKALREDLELLRHWPPPERWIDLLKRLNAEEDRLTRDQRSR